MPAAQEVPPRAVDPRVLSEDTWREDPRIRPDAVPHPEHVLPDSAAPEGAADATFVYRGLRIEGASALHPAVLASAWPYREGETASVADLFEFAAALTRTYRAAGYLLSQAVVPAQTIEDGIVSVRVVEGHVEAVAVAGEVPAGVRDRIRRVAMPVVAERPVTLSGIEGVLLRAQDLAGVSIRGTLSPGETPGGALLTIDVVYERFGFSVDYENALPETLDRDVLSVVAEARLVGPDLLRVSASASPGEGLPARLGAGARGGGRGGDARSAFRPPGRIPVPRVRACSGRWPIGVGRAKWSCPRTVRYCEAARRFFAPGPGYR